MGEGVRGLHTKFDPFISGTTLPHILTGAAVIEHEDSFFILGGYGRGSYKDDIYEYNKDGGQWVEVPTNLIEGRYWHTAMKVKSSLFKSC